MTHGIKDMVYNPVDDQIYVFDNAKGVYKMGVINPKLKTLTYFGQSHIVLNSIDSMYVDSFGTIFGIQDTGELWKLPTYNPNKEDEAYSPVFMGKLEDEIVKSDAASCPLALQMKRGFLPHEDVYLSPCHSSYFISPCSSQNIACLVGNPSWRIPKYIREK